MVIPNNVALLNSRTKRVVERDVIQAASPQVGKSVRRQFDLIRPDLRRRKSRHPDPVEMSLFTT